ncbi:MAG: AraC family transcriptional regulator N-terminal domain-containing protein [Cyanobacteria bacterium REEB67]|nr:AraC family transcriptional regulator N-terminal domain-containing protein [Cyanobacteria bacterium REEB67]
MLGQRAQNEGCTQVANNLNIYRFNRPTPRTHGIFTASICVVAQGAKMLELSGENYRYDPDNFVIASLDVPIIGEVVEASPQKPFLCLKMEFDPSMIASVCVEAGILSARSESSVKSVALGRLSDELLDAFLRLATLFGQKDDYRMISPLVTREIIYRLLKSDQGQRIRQLANFGEQTHRITRAVQYLQQKYKEPLRIENLAGQVNMSISSFHEHFKTTTSMSPLQFQKLLRLQEARRLLLTEQFDAGSAGISVGYDDPSQFSREYKRLFGVSPREDIGRHKKFA